MKEGRKRGKLGVEVGPVEAKKTGIVGGVY